MESDRPMQQPLNDAIDVAEFTDAETKGSLEPNDHISEGSKASTEWKQDTGALKSDDIEIDPNTSSASDIVSDFQVTGTAIESAEDNSEIKRTTAISSAAFSVPLQEAALEAGDGETQLLKNQPHTLNNVSSVFCPLSSCLTVCDESAAVELSSFAIGKNTEDCKLTNTTVISNLNKAISDLMNDPDFPASEKLSVEPTHRDKFKMLAEFKDLNQSTGVDSTELSLNAFDTVSDIKAVDDVSCLKDGMDKMNADDFMQEPMEEIEIDDHEIRDELMKRTSDPLFVEPMDETDIEPVARSTSKLVDEGLEDHVDQSADDILSDSCAGKLADEVSFNPDSRRDFCVEQSADLVSKPADDFYVQPLTSMCLDNIQSDSCVSPSAHELSFKPVDKSQNDDRHVGFGSKPSDDFCVDSCDKSDVDQLSGGFTRKLIDDLVVSKSVDETGDDELLADSGSLLEAELSVKSIVRTDYKDKPAGVFCIESLNRVVEQELSHGTTVSSASEVAEESIVQRSYKTDDDVDDNDELSAGLASKLTDDFSMESVVETDGNKIYEDEVSADSPCMETDELFMESLGLTGDEPPIESPCKQTDEFFLDLIDRTSDEPVVDPCVELVDTMQKENNQKSIEMQAVQSCVEPDRSSITVEDYSAVASSYHCMLNSAISTPVMTSKYTSDVHLMECPDSPNKALCMDITEPSIEHPAAVSANLLSMESPDSPDVDCNAGIDKLDLNFIAEGHILESPDSPPNNDVCAYIIKSDTRLPLAIMSANQLYIESPEFTVKNIGVGFTNSDVEFLTNSHATESHDSPQSYPCTSSSRTDNETVAANPHSLESPASPTEVFCDEKAIASSVQETMSAGSTSITSVFELPPKIQHVLESPVSPGSSGSVGLLRSRDDIVIPVSADRVTWESSNSHDGVSVTSDHDTVSVNQLISDNQITLNLLDLREHHSARVEVLEALCSSESSHSPDDNLIVEAQSDVELLVLRPSNSFSPQSNDLPTNDLSVNISEECAKFHETLSPNELSMTNRLSLESPASPDLEQGSYLDRSDGKQRTSRLAGELTLELSGLPDCVGINLLEDEGEARGLPVLEKTDSKNEIVKKSMTSPGKNHGAEKASTLINPLLFELPYAPGNNDSDVVVRNSSKIQETVSESEVLSDEQLLLESPASPDYDTDVHLSRSNFELHQARSKLLVVPESSDLTSSRDKSMYFDIVTNIHVHQGDSCLNQLITESPESPEKVTSFELTQADIRIQETKFVNQIASELHSLSDDGSCSARTEIEPEIAKSADRLSLELPRSPDLGICEDISEDNVEMRMGPQETDKAVLLNLPGEVSDNNSSELLDRTNEELIKSPTKLKSETYKEQKSSPWSSDYKRTMGKSKSPSLGSTDLVTVKKSNVMSPVNDLSEVPPVGLHDKDFAINEQRLTSCMGNTTKCETGTLRHEMTNNISVQSPSIDATLNIVSQRTVETELRRATYKVCDPFIGSAADEPASLYDEAIDEPRSDSPSVVVDETCEASCALAIDELHSTSSDIDMPESRDSSPDRITSVIDEVEPSREFPYSGGKQNSVTQSEDALVEALSMPVVRHSPVDDSRSSEELSISPGTDFTCIKSPFESNVPTCQACNLISSNQYSNSLVKCPDLILSQDSSVELPICSAVQQVADSALNILQDSATKCSDAAHVASEIESPLTKITLPVAATESPSKQDLFESFDVVSSDCSKGAQMLSKSYPVSNTAQTGSLLGCGSDDSVSDVSNMMLEKFTRPGPNYNAVSAAAASDGSKLRSSLFEVPGLSSSFQNPSFDSLGSFISQNKSFLPEPQPLLVTQLVGHLGDSLSNAACNVSQSAYSNPVTLGSSSKNAAGSRLKSVGSLDAEIRYNFPIHGPFHGMVNISNKEIDVPERSDRLSMSEVSKRVDRLSCNIRPEKRTGSDHVEAMNLSMPIRSSVISREKKKLSGVDSGSQKCVPPTVGSNLSGVSPLNAMMKMTNLIPSIDLEDFSRSTSSKLAETSSVGQSPDSFRPRKDSSSRLVESAPPPYSQDYHSTANVAKDRHTWSLAQKNELPMQSSSDIPFSGWSPVKRSSSGKRPGMMSPGKYQEHSSLVMNEQTWLLPTMAASGSFGVNADQLHAINVEQRSVVSGGLKQHGTSAGYLQPPDNAAVFAGEFAEDCVSGRQDSKRRNISESHMKHYGVFDERNAVADSRMYQTSSSSKVVETDYTRIPVDNYGTGPVLDNASIAKHSYIAPESSLNVASSEYGVPSYAASRKDILVSLGDEGNKSQSNEGLLRGSLQETSFKARKSRHESSPRKSSAPKTQTHTNEDTVEPCVVPASKEKPTSESAFESKETSIITKVTDDSSLVSRTSTDTNAASLNPLKLKIRRHTAGQGELSVIASDSTQVSKEEQESDLFAGYYPTTVASLSPGGVPSPATTKSKTMSGRAKTKGELKKQLLERREMRLRDGGSQASSPAGSYMTSSPACSHGDALSPLSVHTDGGPSTTPQPSPVLHATTPKNSSELPTKMISKREDPVKYIDSPDDSCVVAWTLGDMLWAKVSGHPWWPCVIAPDPDLSIFTKNVQRRQKTTQRQYHVHFYGDENERGWVLETAVIPFDAHETYNQLVERMVREFRRERKHFIIPPNRRQAWNLAVAAAELAYMMPRQKRVEAWLDRSSIDDVELFPVGNKKVKDVKSVKPEDVRPGNPDVVQVNLPDPVKTSGSWKYKGDDKREQEVKQNQPVTDISRDEVEDSSNRPPPPPHIRVPKNMSNQQIAQFTVFCQKRRSSVQNENPGVSDEQIDSILQDQWNRLDKETKARFIPMGSDVTHLSQIMSSAAAGEGITSMDKKTSKSTREKHESVEVQHEVELKDVERHNGRETRRKSTFESPVATSIRDQRRLEDGSKVAVIEESKIPPKKRGRKSATYEKEENKSEDDKIRREVDEIDVSGEVDDTRKSKSETKKDDNLAMEKKKVRAEELKLPSSLPLEDKSRPTVLSNELVPLDSRVTVCRKCNTVVDFDATVCTGPCHGSFHKQCIVNSATTDSSLKCGECTTETYACFKCKSSSRGANVRCSVEQCRRYYHKHCLATRLSSVDFICPLHRCATCETHAASDDIADVGKRYYECVLCPTAYHESSSKPLSAGGQWCLAAGSELIAGRYITCPQHFVPVKSNTHHSRIHITWCCVCEEDKRFIYRMLTHHKHPGRNHWYYNGVACVVYCIYPGDDLLSCDTCPLSYHERCGPNGLGQCPTCATGRRPLYGDMIWVKFGSYRWWPGEICYPGEIPLNIYERPHQVGEFVVCFYGSHDYLWTHRGRVFRFHPTDKCYRDVSNAKGLSKEYAAAISEALSTYQQLHPSGDQLAIKRVIKEGKVDERSGGETALAQSSDELIDWKMEIKPILSEKSVHLQPDGSGSLCALCGRQGRLICCDKARCGKKYHLPCLQICRLPHGTWLCPWHHCILCARPAIASCVLCPVAYCIDHVQGNIHVTLKFDVQCTNHEDSPPSNEDFVNAWLQFFASVKPVTHRKLPAKLRQRKSLEGSDEGVLTSGDVERSPTKRSSQPQSKTVTSKTGLARGKTKAAKECNPLSERRVSERSIMARQREPPTDSVRAIASQPEEQSANDQRGRTHRKNKSSDKMKKSTATKTRVDKSTPNKKRKRSSQLDFEESDCEKLPLGGETSLVSDPQMASSLVIDNIEHQIKVKHSHKRIKVSKESADDEPPKQKKEKSRSKSGLIGSDDLDVPMPKKKKSRPISNTSFDSDDELFDLDFSSKSRHKKSSRHDTQDTPRGKNKHRSSADSFGDTTPRGKHKHRSSTDSFSDATPRSKQKHQLSTDVGGGLSTAEVLWSSMLASSSTEPHAPSRVAKPSTSAIKERDAKMSGSAKPPVLKSFMDEPLFDDDDDFPQLVIDVPTI